MSPSKYSSAPKSPLVPLHEHACKHYCSFHTSVETHQKLVQHIFFQLMLWLVRWEFTRSKMLLLRNAVVCVCTFSQKRKSLLTTPWDSYLMDQMRCDELQCPLICQFARKKNDSYSSDLLIFHITSHFINMVTHCIIRQRN